MLKLMTEEERVAKRDDSDDDDEPKTKKVEMKTVAQRPLKFC